jgi:purine-binding chemotaxis protein CheW
MENTHIKQANVSFRLNNELFAISAFKVLEVLEQQRITQIPNAPAYIKGVINFRGDVLPVIDMRRKFGMPDRTEDQKFVIIVLDLKSGNDTLQLGAMADSVKDVIEIDERDLKPVPKMGSSYNSEFILGMIHTDNGFIMLLDADKVFSMEELSILAQASEL